jgi:hypothetical protein
MSFQQLFKISVMQGRTLFTYRGRFASIREALDFYSERGRVIEIKEVTR